LFLLDPRVVVLNFLGAGVCWTLELDAESKEEVPSLGTEVLIGEVHEAIAFC
jgi:hypothetical protein